MQNIRMSYKIERKMNMMEHDGQQNDEKLEVKMERWDLEVG